jgi:alpha/beta superfamily hydrolase
LTRKFTLQGPAGTIEALQDQPAEPAHMRGVAVVCHPHPLFGGTMENKVVQTLARAFVQCGWRAVRFNFRGVGTTQGVHDEGRGELQDLLAVIEQCGCGPDGAPLPLALGAFSFGAFVTSCAVVALGPARTPHSLVLVGTPATRFDVAAVPHALHEDTLVLHGELDETVPLADVMQWARPQSLPVTVIPGASHFFHGQLPLLRSLVVRHLRANPLEPH